MEKKVKRITSQQISDDLIWKGIRSGEEKSLTLLIGSYSNILFSYGCKFTSDKAMLKDCIQDLFINIWKNRATLAESVTIKAYLLASIRRLIYRKVKSKNPVALGYDEQFMDELPFQLSFSLENKIIADESLHVFSVEIGKRIEALAARQREVIYLKYFLGLSRDEMAEITGISPQTVSNTLQSAIKNLRTGMVGQYERFRALLLFF